MSKLEVNVRPAAQGDVSLIFSSWLKSFRNGTANCNVSNSIYFAEQHKLIEALMKRCEVHVACSTKNPGDIYGWICFERVQGIFTLHYVYVKQTFRSLGVANALLNLTNHDFNMAGLYTHETKIAERLAAKFTLIYHPYILINYVPKSDDAPSLVDTHEERAGKVSTVA